MRENSENLLISVFLILLIFAASVVRAEEATTLNVSQITAEEVAPAPIEKKLSASISLEHGVDLKSKSNPDKKESTTLIVEPEYIIQGDTKLNARTDFIQNYDSERKTAITNTVVVLTPTKIDAAKELAFMPEVSVSIPTDSDMREKESFRGGISLRPTLTYNVNPKLSILERLYLTKNFHEFETKADYSPNVEYSIRNRLAVSYAFNDKWSVDATNDFVKAFTYKGYSRETFYFGQSVNYKFKKVWTAYLMHENEGSARGPNNHGENVAFADTKSSFISLGINYVF